MQEKKGLTRTLNDETGLEESCLSHMRVIGERSYTLKHSITDEDEKEEMIETDMNNEELEKFKNEWEEKWIPSIREAESDILKMFLKRNGKRSQQLDLKRLAPLVWQSSQKIL